MTDIPDNFKMYLSIHETTKILSNEEHGKLMKAIQSVQFYEVHIDAIVFSEPMLQLAWASSKIQIRKQIDGFCSVKKVRYDGMFKGTTQAPYEGTTQAPTQQSEPQPQIQSEPQPQIQSEPQSEPQPKAQVVELSPTLLSGIKVSEYLFSKILTENPKFKQPNISTWSKDIDKAIRLDNRTERELIGCIDWIYTDKGSFWMPNILSAKKLREKFDSMQAQSRSKDKQKETMVDKIYDAGMTAKDMIKEMEKRA